MEEQARGWQRVTIVAVGIGEGYISREQSWVVMMPEQSGVQVSLASAFVVCRGFTIARGELVEIEDHTEGRDIIVPVMPREREEC